MENFVDDDISRVSAAEEREQNAEPRRHHQRKCGERRQRRQEQIDLSSERISAATEAPRARSYRDTDLFEADPFHQPGVEAMHLLQLEKSGDQPARHQTNRPRAVRQLETRSPGEEPPEQTAAHSFEQ